MSSGEESNLGNGSDFRDQDIIVNKWEELSTKWKEDPSKQPFVSDLKKLVDIYQEVSKLKADESKVIVCAL